MYNENNGNIIFKTERGHRQNDYYAIMNKDAFFSKYDYCTLSGMRADIKGSTCQFGWYDGKKNQKYFFIKMVDIQNVPGCVNNL